MTVIHDCITSSVKLKLSVAKIRSIWMVVESNGSASLLLNTHQSITMARVVLKTVQPVQVQDKIDNG